MLSPEQTLIRYQQLRVSLRDKSDMYQRKVQRARSAEKVKMWSERAMLIRQALARTNGFYYDLLYTVERAAINAPRRVLGDNSLIVQHHKHKAWNRYQAARKAEGIEKFNKPHYAMWFISNSLGADYGEYTCDKCNTTFYHSPSTITEARREVYHCCCGHCTNQIIKQAWNETPYQ